MNIKDLCKHLQDSGLSLEQIGELLGVSRLQVTNYLSGKTVNPKPQVAFNAWDNVLIEGEPVLLDQYKNPQHLADTKFMMGL